MWQRLKSFIKKIDYSYEMMFLLLSPINKVLSFFLKNRCYPNSVLHISYMVHVPYYTVRLLRREGMKADYLAIGKSSCWNESDYSLDPQGFGAFKMLKEMIAFWTIAANYEIVHLHFMLSVTKSGWDLPLLKSMGRKIVVHYRGCEIRDYKLNMSLHPKVNICQKCDYNRSACTGSQIMRRRMMSQKYGDLFLVTTPDLKDFAPNAIFFPLFAPDDEFVPVPSKVKRVHQSIKIVHATNHPGIEGTDIIKETIDRLIAKGYPIELVFLTDKPYHAILEEYATADLAIGKMKMGYYANAQIESLYSSVPTVTYVRPEFVTEEIESSGLILSHLDHLEVTLEYFLSHPAELQKKKEIAKTSALKLHNNRKLAKQLVQLYNDVKLGKICQDIKQ